MTHHGPIIEVRGLSLAIGGKQILRDVSLAVHPGEYLSIVGPNGAGKTTLLRCLLRILRPSGGEVLVAGRPLESYSQRQLARVLSYVPQTIESGLPYTVSEMVMMGRYAYFRPLAPISKADRQIVCDTLERTGLVELAERPIATLSGGERQKVFIAAALAQQAQVLLLDEPTTFLDYRHQAEVCRLLVEVNRTLGSTIVAVTHDVNTAALHSRQIVALRQGQVAFDGAPQELMRPEVLARIYDSPLLMVTHPTANLPVIVPQ